MRVSLLLTRLYILSFTSWSLASLSKTIGSRADEELCYLFGHRVALVGNRLFFMFGNYTFTSTKTNSALYYPYLFSLDLSTNLRVEAYIPESSLQRYSLPPNVIHSVDYTPSPVQSPLLWYSNDTLYTFPSKGDQNILETFDTTTNMWSSITVSGSNVNLKNGSSEMLATIPSRGLSFSFGVSMFQAYAQQGFITFNASQPDYPNWNNQTVNGQDGIQVPFISEAELVYLPMGNEGVLLLIGGIDNSDWTMSPLSHISVYDIQSKNWYGVTATGDLPEARSQFCAVVSASVDQSTFQVTIFGGWNGYLGRNYEDVFVLTVPSFRWIKVHDINDFEDTGDNLGRGAPRCVIYKDAQMIMLGGRVKSSENYAPCEAAYPPLRVLDTSSYTWKEVFDPSVEYRVPDIVTNVIGGNATGSANLTEPEGGWKFTALQTIFSQRIFTSQTVATTAPVSTATSPSNAGPRASDNKSSPNGPKKHAGAIAGSVVPVGVLLIAALLLYLLYRARASKAKRQQSTDKRENEETGVELPESNAEQVFEVHAHEPAELEPGNRFELSETPVRPPINQFELPGR